MVEPLTLPIVPLRLSMIPRVPPLKGCMLTRWMMELVLLVEGVTLSGISPSLKRHTASVSGVLLLCVLSLKTVSLSPCEKEKGAPTYPLLEGFIEQFQSWERVPRRDPAGEDDDHSTLVGRFLQALLVLAVPANVTDTPADLEIFRHILSLMPVIDETTNDMIPEPDPEISARLQMIETINDADIHPTVTGMNHGGLHKLECPIPSGLTAGAALTLLLSLVNWLAPTLLLDERLVDGAQVIKWEQITDCQTNKTSAASQLISPFSKAFTDLPDLVPSLKVALPVLLASSDRPGTLELLYFILAGRPELLPLCRDHFSPSVIADLCDDLASGDSDTRKVVVWLSLVMLIADRSWWATGSKQVAYEIPEW
ncbi:MAG: hypothetical protein KVP17_001939 [Porospora cf. gigantea B]|nr:MAG: hypothetical protein KVP17_001939 [Porospora cf. gigantea B]